MLLLILVVFLYPLTLFGVLADPSGSEQEKPPIYWFEQPLNHFDSRDNRTWKQRYSINEEYYRDGGPVILNVFGEEAMIMKKLHSGFSAELAKKFNAMILLLEHRYYGESYPTPNLRIANLRYLTSCQALKDIEAFIKGMKKERGLSSNRWILFGTSYSGSLVAWARKRFPDQVFAAVSSSAPVMAQTDFKEFFGVVVDQLYKTDEKCVPAFILARQAIDEMIKSPEGRETIQKQFELCDPINITNPRNVQKLYKQLAGNIAGIDQFNEENTSARDIITLSLEEICKIMTNESIGQPVERLSVMQRTYLDEEHKCISTDYDSSIDSLQRISWKAPSSSGGRQWRYQTCNELGFLQTSSLDITRQVFGEFPLEYTVEKCTSTFGITLQQINEGVANTNRRYGGKSFHMSRVIFVNGSEDPWHPLGITNSRWEDMPAFLIYGSSHGGDSFASSDRDSPQLVETREKIESILRQWLSE